VDGAGTISGRWALAAGRAGVNGCRICHGPTLPGTRLCTQCKAALKRARQETVSELAPPLKRPASRSATRTPRAANAVPSQRTIAPRGWRGTAIALLGIAVIALGYAALHLANPVHPVAPLLPDSPPPLTATPAAPSTTPQPVAAARAREDPLSASQAAKPASPRPTPKRTVEAAPMRASTPVDRLPTVAEPPAPAPAPEPAPAPRPAPPPRDRWQLMADEIAQCGRDGFVSGVICEQKIRLRYCEGYWGQAAQCPSGIPNDHGQ
jgi:hypothetical protein